MPKLKKEIYKFTEVGAMLFDMFPGHYLNLKSAIATVNTCARELGIGDINGKKSYRNMTAKDAERVLASCGESLRQYTTTPIERAIRNADETPEISEAPAEPVQAPTETVVDKMTGSKKFVILPPNPALNPAAQQFYELCEDLATKKKAEDDAFEIRRKKFYTDVNYFIKYAQSPQERLAIWEAISKLYGISIKAGT